MSRNYEDLDYKVFRRAVRKRDQKTCKWPECGRKRAIQVHHIYPWAQFPTLRYTVDNGICLCKIHHKVVTKNELEYARFLKLLIQEKL